MKTRSALQKPTQELAMPASRRHRIQIAPLITALLLLPTIACSGLAIDLELPATPSPTPTLLPTPASTLTSTPLPTPTPDPTPEPPSILSFAAEPMEVDVGGIVTLSWETVGDATTLCTVASSQPVPSCETVPSSGTTTTVAEMKQTYSFFLQVKAGDEETTAQIDVQARCPYTWEFPIPSAAHAPLGCPSTPFITSGGVAQPFQNGIMIWIENLDEIFVFCSSCPTPWGDHYYKRFEGSWGSDTPEEEIDPPTQQGHYPPAERFRAVWQHGVIEPGGASLRDALGWATASASEFQTAYQCQQHNTKWGVFENCYVLGTENAYLTDIYIDPITDHYGGWVSWPR